MEECAECGTLFTRPFVVRTAVGIYDHGTGRVRLIPGVGRAHCERAVAHGKTCEKCGKQALRDIIVNFGNTVEHVPSMESQYDLYVYAGRSSCSIV